MLIDNVLVESLKLICIYMSCPVSYFFSIWPYFRVVLFSCLYPNFIGDSFHFVGFVLTLKFVVRIFHAHKHKLHVLSVPILQNF